jgi:hypothetical protein
MRWILLFLGVIMMLMGITWTLQGANILLGSIMSGDPFWLVVGIVAIIVGAALAIFGWRWQSKSPR